MSNFKNITAAELQVLRATEKIQLVDVRTDAEMAYGVIEGAVKMPLHLLPMRLAELNAALPTVFYCQMGGRSAQAAAFAANQGVAGVYNLQGGIMAWAQSGEEIVT